MFLFFALIASAAVGYLCGLLLGVAGLIISVPVAIYLGWKAVDWEKRFWSR
jgi:hypothetical protein